MRKLILPLFCFLLLTGCTQAPAADESDAAPIPDGVYSAEFHTDSSMFHVNESMEGRGVLTVEGGKMLIHITMPSKSILNLYPGTAEDAQKEGAVLLEPTLDSVTYSDGWQEEVYGFDIPVPYLNEEFDCALVGKKGTWYDHKVFVADVQEHVLPENAASDTTPDQESGMTVEVTLSGGSGKASVVSPCRLEKDEEGQYWAEVVWSSKNYMFMLVGDAQYDPIQEEGNSTFRIPVQIDADMSVSAQTVAMSGPHLVDYVLYFDSDTIRGD